LLLLRLTAFHRQELAMRWSGAFFLALVIPALATAQDEVAVRQVAEALKALNDAYLKKDMEAIKRLTGEDLVVVTSSGERQTREEQLKSLPDLKFTDYRTDAVRITTPSKDVAIAMFQSTVAGTFKGKELPSRAAVVTVWVQRGGKWLEVLYQSTPLPGK
jgi:uncharacterized protein (TIGR02246 family)